MIKRASLALKVGFGFGLVLVLLSGMALVAWNALEGSSAGFNDYRGLARDTNLVGRAQANLLMVRLYVKDFIKTGSQQSVDKFNEYYDKAYGFMTEAQSEIKNPQRAALIDKVDAAMVEYKRQFGEVIKLRAERDRLLTEILNVKGAEMEKGLAGIMLSAHEDQDAAAAYNAGIALRHLLLARLYVVKFLDSNDQRDVDRVQAEFSKFIEVVGVLDKELQNTERRRLLGEVTSLVKVYTENFAKIVEAILKRNGIIHNYLDKLGPAMAADIEEVELSVKKEQDELGPRLQADNQKAITFILAAALVALAIGILVSIFLTKSITKPFKQIFQGLKTFSALELEGVRARFREVIDNLSSGSDQIQAASQQMAEGASEQAANIEEISSSLEEMSSMTKQNADNADQADSLMKETNRVVGQANSAMSDLTKSMEEIATASDETSKIVKTIDEIAFQTNLLALNAAVEAARAGEAGAGFAVVADEVRNLAQRAAEAAKNTAGLIEDTVKKVKDGSGIVVRTNEAFGNVSSSAQKIGELVGEISAASTEQAQGIDQINQAVNQMDKVIQMNASGTEELSSQAMELNDMVGVVVDIVEGSQGGRKTTVSQKADFRPAAPKLGARAIPHSPTKPTVAKADEVFPMDDDFEDF